MIFYYEVNPQHSRILHSRNSQIRDFQFLYQFYIRDTLASHIREFFLVWFCLRRSAARARTATLSALSAQSSVLQWPW
jgi:hypothetical protein